MKSKGLFKRKRSNESCASLIRSDSKKVYHGSPVYIPKPDTWHSHPPLDFGTGFYVTEYREYARTMAMEKVPASNDGITRFHLMQYEYDDDIAEEKLDILHFDDSDEDWARYLVGHRALSYDGPEYDIVEGPSADASIDDVMEEYKRQCRKGNVNWSEIADMFESQNARDQILFHTPRSLRGDFIRIRKHWYDYEYGPRKNL